MKRKITFLMAALMLLCGLGWAQTSVTWPASTALPDTATAVNGDENITIKVSSTNPFTNPLRIYANTTVTINAQNDAKITSVTYTAYSTGNYVTNAQNATVSPEVTPTVNSTNVTWTYAESNNVTEFTFKPSTQTRSNGITITYVVGNSDIATPTFSPASGTEFYDEGLEVTISCETEDVDIYYTLDGTDPTDESEPYNGAISITETTTIKAIAYDGDDNVSNIAIATYTYVDLNAPGAINNPYTVAQARAAIDVGTGTTNVYATGIVSSIPTAWSTQYNNISFNFVDNDGDTDFLQAFRCVSSNNADASEVAVGDSVVVYGSLTLYNSTTYEFNAGCQLVSLTHPTHAVETPTFSPEAGTYAEAQTVTISCETEDVDIYYTLDGTDPTDESEPYSSAITVDGPTTIKAIAYDGNNNSAIATASYHICSADNAYTVAQALAFVEYPANGIYVQGIVSTAPSSLSSGTLTYYISDDGEATNQLQVYKGKGLENASFTSTDDIQVGDIVTIYGNVKIYNETYEFDNGNYLVAWERPVSTEPTINASNIEIAYDATTGEIAYTIDNPVDGVELTATTDAEWISDLTVGESSITFTTTENEGDDDRTATITLSGPLGSSASVSCTQHKHSTITLGWSTSAPQWVAQRGILEVKSGLSGSETVSFEVVSGPALMRMHSGTSIYVDITGAGDVTIKATCDQDSGKTGTITFTISAPYFQFMGASSGTFYVNPDGSNTSVAFGVFDAPTGGNRFTFTNDQLTQALGTVMATQLYESYIKPTISVSGSCLSLNGSNIYASSLPNPDSEYFSVQSYWEDASEYNSIGRVTVSAESGSHMSSISRKVVGENPFPHWQDEPTALSTEYDWGLISSYKHPDNTQHSFSLSAIDADSDCQGVAIFINDNPASDTFTAGFRIARTTAYYGSYDFSDVSSLTDHIGGVCKIRGYVENRHSHERYYATYGHFDLFVCSAIGARVELTERYGTEPNYSYATAMVKCDFINDDTESIFFTNAAFDACTTSYSDREYVPGVDAYVRHIAGSAAVGNRIYNLTREGRFTSTEDIIYRTTPHFKFDNDNTTAKYDAGMNAYFFQATGTPLIQDGLCGSDPHGYYILYLLEDIQDIQTGSYANGWIVE